MRKSFFNKMYRSDDEGEVYLLKNLKSDFQIMTPIKKRRFCMTFCNRGSKYKKMLLKSQSSLNKELDLRKFIYRQRVTMMALLGLLSGGQSFLIDKMS